MSRAAFWIEAHSFLGQTSASLPADKEQDVRRRLASHSEATARPCSGAVKSGERSHRRLSARTPAPHSGGGEWSTRATCRCCAELDNEFGGEWDMIVKDYGRWRLALGELENTWALIR
jgi:hypothetical protein